MRKDFRVILLLVVFTLIFFAQTNLAFAQATGFFGGKITSIESLPVKFKEWAGYMCFVQGVSISIVPFGPSTTPKDYLIPFYVSSKTGTTPQVGQWILGTYLGEVPITCMLEISPYTIDTIYLHSISLFGTSK